MCSGGSGKYWQCYNWFFWYNPNTVVSSCHVRQWPTTYFRQHTLCKWKQVCACIQPRQLGCQHGTTHICCWAPCGGPVLRRRCYWRPPLLIDIFGPHGAQHQTCRTQLQQSNDGTDARTDARTDTDRYLAAPHKTRTVPINCAVEKYMYFLF